MSTYDVYVGVDIAATSATVTWQPTRQNITKPLTIAQTPAGFATLQRALAATGALPQQTLLVMEATGSYWLSLATYFVRQGYGLFRTLDDQRPFAKIEVY